MREFRSGSSRVLITTDLLVSGGGRWAGRKKGKSKLIPSPGGPLVPLLRKVATWKMIWHA